MNLIEIKKKLEKYYPNIKSISSIKKLNLDFTTLSEVYKVYCNDKKFILKINHNSKEFYGDNHVEKRFETIGHISSLMHAKRFPVEKIIKNKNGKYVTVNKDRLLRLFVFIESNKINDIDIDKNFYEMIKLSNRLHNFPLKLIEDNNINIQKELSVPYPLDCYNKYIDLIHRNLELEKGRKWDEFKLYFLNIDDEIQLVTNWKKDNKQRNLTHMDLRLENVLFSKKNKATLIDLDMMRFENPYICLGFTFSRTFFNHKSFKSLSDIEIFLDNLINLYSLKDKNKKLMKRNILFGAKYIEIEKIIRNTYRYYKTKLFRKFTDDILIIHFPIVKIIDNLINRYNHKN